MRVQDYALPKEVPTETKEFLDDIRRILNNGGYVPQTIAAVPGWAGEQGESVHVLNGNEQRLYYYNGFSGIWNFGLPLSTQYGWTYITVTASEASHVGTLAFTNPFQSAPIVICQFIGYMNGGTPASPADFSTGLTKMVVSSYNATTTAVGFAVYTGDGSNFAGAYHMGIGWIAIG